MPRAITYSGDFLLKNFIPLLLKHILILVLNKSCKPLPCFFQTTSKFNWKKHLVELALAIVFEICG